MNMVNLLLACALLPSAFMPVCTEVQIVCLQSNRDFAQSPTRVEHTFAALPLCSSLRISASSG